MVKPKKHLGQHFLTESAIAKRIADALDLSGPANVLEIGPGKGILTQHLLDKKNANLKVVELDVESVHYLNDHYPDLKVLFEDFLKLDFQETFDGGEFKLIGNFPYNISSQIVFSILDNKSLVNEMVGMFQKEVARRICSEPGNKDYGILSVLAQANYDTSYLFTVNEGSFFPPPKVKSGVIRLVRKEDHLDEKRYRELKELVKTAFNQRRKQLGNSIKNLLPPNFQHPFLIKRPEQLHYTEFLSLLNDMHSV